MCHPPVPRPLTLNSGSVNIVQFQVFAALEWELLFMVILQHLSSLKHHEGLMRSKALQVGEVLGSREAADPFSALLTTT